MPEQLTIRQYNAQDADRVTELHYTAMEAVGALIERKDDLDTDLDHVESTYLNSEADFLVGEYNERIVAMGAFKPPSEYYHNFFSDIPPTAAEITRMRVEPEFQGRGFGGQIYDVLERRAQSVGYDTLLLDTTPQQNAAQKLYTKKGFREICRKFVNSEGEEFTILFFKKSL